MPRSFSLTLAAIALLSVGCSSNKPAAPAEQPKAAEVTPPPAAENAIVGEVKWVDPEGTRIVVRTSDGNEHSVEVTKDTEVHTLHDGAVDVAKGTSAMAKTTAEEVKKGTVAAVQFTEKEGKLVASKVGTASKEVVQETEVVVTKIDNEGRKIFLKSKDGVEQAYEVGKNATIATGQTITDVGKVTGSKIAEGTKATIHFSERQGQKILHFMKQ